MSEPQNNPLSIEGYFIADKAIILLQERLLFRGYLFS
jgi:hypothetical protein